MKKKLTYVLIILCLMAGIVSSCGKKETGDAKTESKTDKTEQADDQNSQESKAESDTPLYGIKEIPEIDLYAQKHEPKEKSAGMKWNRELFYWLEDVDPDSDSDGNLSKAIITKSQLKNKETGNIIQYDIYKSPGSGIIYKIVSVEAVEEG